MIWAANKYQEGIRKKATRDDRKGFCPSCGKEVISKCGSIKIWHWAHKQQEECDSFGEPETEWHIGWKNQFPEEWQEVIVEKHRIDVKTKEGLIIEFQNSSISPEQIEEREKFYGNMIWVLNGKTIAKNLAFFKQRYKWKWIPKSWQSSNKQIFIDLGDIFLYKLDSISSNGTFYKISKDAFIVQNGGNPWKKKSQASLPI